MVRLRHSPGPGAHLDCLLKDAALYLHGVCSFSLANGPFNSYSPRINIRHLSVLFLSYLRCRPTTNNPFSGSDDHHGNVFASNPQPHLSFASRPGGVYAI